MDKEKKERVKKGKRKWTKKKKEIKRGREKKIKRGRERQGIAKRTLQRTCCRAARSARFPGTAA